MEKAAEEGASSQAGRAPGPGQGPGFARGPGRGLGGAEGPGGRPERKRSLKDTPAPEFRLMPGSVKIYMLSVPTDSPLKIVPQGIRPTIRMEGQPYRLLVHIRGSAHGSGNNQEERKTRPGRRAGALPRSLRDGLAGGGRPERDRAQPAGQSAGNVAGTDQLGDHIVGRWLGRQRSRGCRARPARSRDPALVRGGVVVLTQGAGWVLGGPGMSGRPGFSGSSGQPGGQMVGTATAAGGSQDAMVQLRVDAAKLPKAEELKALMFPETLAVVVDDASIRLVSRESFPDVVNGLHLATGFAPGLLPAFNAAWARALAAAWATPGQAAPTARAGQPPARGTTSRRRWLDAEWRTPRTRASGPSGWRPTRVMSVPPRVRLCHQRNHIVSETARWKSSMK